ncbi:hypothetical protein PTTG_00415 [Puccinia triticina 1-1 BBBD Race 1]|uniref:Uncharacterized protein n=1 Tax=Puccinia triticina (isolate 1-1 / race 1 (BBBD)) TaxID=630390 RepID=A0A0C4EI49_PUCT1|nr:hypothetical protein PTTG_00415 [Puccinia triticina 1-1 BBBD Race 1]
MYFICPHMKYKLHFHYSFDVPMADPVQDGTNFYPVAGRWSPAYADQDHIVLPPPGLPSPVYSTIKEPGSSASRPIVLEEASLPNIPVGLALLNACPNPTPEPTRLRTPIKFGLVTDCGTEAAPPVPEPQPAPAPTAAEMIEFDHFAIC